MVVTESTVIYWKSNPILTWKRLTATATILKYNFYRGDLSQVWKRKIDDTTKNKKIDDKKKNDKNGFEILKSDPISLSANLLYFLRKPF